jgi:hypothetical protein
MVEKIDDLIRVGVARADALLTEGLRLKRRR